MLKANHRRDENLGEAGVEKVSTRFEDTLMLVFNGPMCFECLDEAENDFSEALEEDHEQNCH